MTMSILQLIIRGKWKSPQHSNQKSRDDTHKIKGEILNKIGKLIYEKKVGKNPDLDIDPKTKKIVLKGRGELSRKIFETEINADDFFIQFFVIAEHTPYLYRHVRHHITDQYYVIPPDIEILSLLLDHIFRQTNNLNFEIEIVI